MEEGGQVFFGGAGASARPEREDSDDESDTTVIRELKEDIVRTVESNLDDKIRMIVDEKTRSVMKIAHDHAHNVLTFSDEKKSIMTRLTELERRIRIPENNNGDINDLKERMKILEDSIILNDNWDSQSAGGSENTDISMIHKNSNSIRWMKRNLHVLRESINEFGEFREKFRKLRLKIVSILDNDHLHRDIVNALTTNPNQPSVGLSLNALAAIRSDLQDVASTFRDYQHGFYR